MRIVEFGRRMARSGFIAINADYRSEASAFEAADRHTKVLEAVEDLNSAVNFFLRVAPQRVNLNQIVIAGDSSGGKNVLWAAYLPSARALVSGWNIAAVISISGAVQENHPDSLVQVTESTFLTGFNRATTQLNYIPLVLIWGDQDFAQDHNILMVNYLKQSLPFNEDSGDGLHFWYSKVPDLTGEGAGGHVPLYYYDENRMHNNADFMWGDHKDAWGRTVSNWNKLMTELTSMIGLTMAQCPSSDNHNPPQGGYANPPHSRTNFVVTESAPSSCLLRQRNKGCTRTLGSPGCACNAAAGHNPYMDMLEGSYNRHLDTPTQDVFV